MVAIKISKVDLAQKVEEGWKKAQLAEHYGLPMAQMTKVLQAAGLQIRKFHAPKFELVEEVEEVEVLGAVDVSEATDGLHEATTVEQAPVATGQGW